MSTQNHTTIWRLEHCDGDNHVIQIFDTENGEWRDRLMFGPNEVDARRVLGIVQEAEKIAASRARQQVEAVVFQNIVGAYYHWDSDQSESGNGARVALENVISALGWRDYAVEELARLRQKYGDRLHQTVG